jgi:hypothetical protein
MTDPKHTSIVEALYDLQQEVGALHRDSDNPFFKSRFASFPAIKALVEPMAWAHGLFVRQSLRTVNGVDVLRNRLYFNGELDDDDDVTMHLPVDNPQGHGSATSYYRRYAYTTCLGLVTEADDDGNAASRPKASTTARRAAPHADPETGEITGDVATMGLRELTAALQEAKLPLTGGTEAKRLRLAEHRAGIAPAAPAHTEAEQAMSNTAADETKPEYAEDEEPF